MILYMWDCLYSDVLGSRYLPCPTGATEFINQITNQSQRMEVALSQSLGGCLGDFSPCIGAHVAEYIIAEVGGGGIRGSLHYLRESLPLLSKHFL